MIRTGHSLSYSNHLVNLSLTMLKEHKPKRVLLACFWPAYVTKNLNEKDLVYDE